MMNDELKLKKRKLVFGLQLLSAFIAIFFMASSFISLSDVQYIKGTMFLLIGAFLFVASAHDPIIKNVIRY